MSIWFNKELSVEHFAHLGKGTMGEYLGIEWTELGDNFMKARMPVDDRTKQPYGLLHGGASCTLAETIGSVASAMVVDQNRFQCVGLEINANHVHSATSGFVTGIATPLHLGKSTHVWDIKIFDENERMVCISRLTVAIIQRRDFVTPRSL
ncbi:MAG: hotdog fold thioesterase [Ferruginibacter sp.]|jgi:1,4-dihydroxy-2-naphthoyl-CoA hydrolase|nr:hotdog fold thioesterase [Chitinophagaceae bacterium]